LGWVAEADTGAKCRPFPMADRCVGTARNDSGPDGVLCMVEVKAESIGGGTWQIFQQSSCRKVELK
jgi:hypothetical protein